MKPSISLVCGYCVALLLIATSSVGGDRDYLLSVVSLVEMDYEDDCKDRSTATWEELTGAKNGLAKKLERDKAFGLFAQHRRDDVKNGYSENAIGPEDEILKRKAKLLLQPGDVLLDTKQWIRLIEFADNAQNQLRFATNYDCGSSVPCPLREFHNSFYNQPNEKTLEKMKEVWEKNLPDLNVYLEQILPLLRNSSKDYQTVEKYWDSLVEYEGALLKARELWSNIQPLYTKLHKYAALKLRGPDAVGKSLPVHLLRSLNGEDWSNIIESLLPKHPAIYQKVHANLQLQNLGGYNAFKKAAELIAELNLGQIKGEVWSNSVFNGTCPPVLVDWCIPNKVKVISCKDVSIGNYLDAFETAMKILYKQDTAIYSNNTYILREAPRYSAIYEAIPGFLSLLALSPHALDRNKLFSLETFNLNANHHRLVLQLILGLRDLPKLNYYLAADEWRLKVLSGAISPTNVTSSWKEFRNQFSQLETSDVDLLADPYVLMNKPFIGKFMGLILKYQIFQSFAEELESDDSDLLKHVASNNERLRYTMMQGFVLPWPETVSDLLDRKENGLEYTGITDYYRLLDEHLDLELDPTINEVDEIDDYLEPEKDEKSDDYKFDLTGATEVEDPYPEEPPLEDVKDNEMDNDIETTTVGMLHVKNYIDDNKKENEESYNVYWWIAIGVAIAIVAVVIAIIARKRYNHRKQLEKQRRENSRA